MGIGHKISGFFTAVILAAVSFFVIYFFCPNFAEKSLGMSFKSGKVNTVQEQTENSSGKNLKTLDNMLDKTKDFTDKLTDTVSQKLTDDIKNKISDKVSETEDGLSRLFEGK